MTPFGRDPYTAPHMRSVRQGSLLLICLLTAGVAGAADKPAVVRVAVLDVDGNSTSDATDIHYFVQKGLRLSKRDVQVTPLDDVLNAGANATAIQNVAFGQEALAAGLQAFNASNYEEASEQLGQAVTYFEQSFAFLDDPDLYLEALVLQGVSLARDNAKKAGLQVLTKAFVVNRKLEFDGYAAEKALFEKARKKAQASKLTSITVATIPDASRVFVDGRYRGVAPAFRPALPAGLHFVRAERQGYGRIGKRLTTNSENPDGKVEFQLKAARKKAALETLLPGLRTEFGGPEAGQNTMRLQKLLLVDYVVLFRASGASKSKQVEMTFYNLVSGQRLNEVSATVDWSARDRDAKNSVIESAQKLVDVDRSTQVTIIDPAIDPGKTDPGETDGGVVTKWWFWTAIGGVVLAGAAVGLALGLQPDEAPAGLDKDGNGALLLRF